MSNTIICPHCKASVKGGAGLTLADHMHDAACMLEQTRRAQSATVQAGSTHATQYKAGVPFTWELSQYDHTGHGKGYAIANYTRMAPTWCVWLAELTVLPSDYRAEALKHCLPHPAAQRVAQATMRLNPFGKHGRSVKTTPQPTGSRLPPKKPSATNWGLKVHAFTDQLMLTVGP